MVKKAVTRLVRCYRRRFPGARIFLAESPLAVYWGHMSVLDADLKCARQMLDRYKMIGPCILDQSCW